MKLFRYLSLLRWLRVITNSGDKFFNVLLFNHILFLFQTLCSRAGSNDDIEDRRVRQYLGYRERESALRDLRAESANATPSIQEQFFARRH